MEVVITYDDGAVKTAKVKPADFVAFERKYEQGFGEQPRTEHTFYLAWSALHRAGEETRSFDTWLNDVADIDDSDTRPKAKGTARRGNQRKT